MSNTPKLTWANNLRVAATLGVIFIHASSYLTGSLGKIPQNNWILAIIINTAVRWSVPVFVMLTGSFVLGNYNDKIGDFLRKALNKIIIPFFIWSVFYLLHNNWDDLLGNKLSMSQKGDILLENAITGSAVHLWYIYMIIGMYFVIPIFSKWTKYANKKELTIFLVFWFFLLIAYPFIDKYSTDFELNYFTGYIGYLIGGYYFFKFVNLPKALLWTIFIGSITAIAFGTYYLAFQKNVDKEMYLAPLTPGVFLMSASIYLLFKQSNITMPNWINSVVNQICNYSYGIYLVHLIVLAWVDDLVISATDFNPLITITVMSILCLTFSFGIIYLLRKIPFLGKWIG